MCYTSGTTGNPKGVMYSHRSTYMHSLLVTSTANIALSERDRMLVIVPMFHANAWGTPYAAWMIGADLVFPQQFLQAAPISRMIADTKPTLTGAVPTVLNDLLHNAPDTDMSSFRLVMCGGSAVPRGLIDGYQATFGVPIVQGWGMTETSPVCAIGHPPKDPGDGSETDWRVKTGRIIPGVELRITDQDTGEPLPAGEIGILSVRVPSASGADTDGWLRTNDLARLDDDRFLFIQGRADDVIIRGGFKVSLGELESLVREHPGVRDVAAVGLEEPRLGEVPAAAVILEQGATVTPDGLRTWVRERTAPYKVPTLIVVLDSLPMGSSHKVNKAAVREILRQSAPSVIET